MFHNVQQELDKLLDGTRKVAFYEVNYIPEEIQAQIDAGKLLSSIHSIKERDGSINKISLVYLPNNKAYANEFCKLYEACGLSRPYDYNYDRKIGKLLGYNDKEIDAFIANLKKTHKANSANANNGGRINPHEGQEANLLLANKKQVAYFAGDPLSFGQLPQNIQAEVNKGTLIATEKKIHTSANSYFDVIIVYKQQNQRIADELYQTIQESRTIETYDYEYDIKIGKLLGYQDKDIEAYIKILKDAVNQIANSSIN